jgi:hypothetical protein
MQPPRKDRDCTNSINKHDYEMWKFFFSLALHGIIILLFVSKRNKFSSGSLYMKYSFLCKWELSAATAIKLPSIDLIFRSEVQNFTMKENNKPNRLRLQGASTVATQLVRFTVVPEELSGPRGSGCCVWGCGPYTITGLRVADDLTQHKSDKTYLTRTICSLRQALIRITSRIREQWRSCN